MKRHAILSLMILAGWTAFASYTQLDFIKCNYTGDGQSTACTWVNTGYTPACTDKIEMKVRLDTRDSTQTLFCARKGLQEQTMTAFFIWQNSTLTARADRNTTHTGTTRDFADDVEDHVFVYDGNALAFFCDGAKLADLATGSFTVGSPLSLFASHTAGTGLYAGTAVGNNAKYRFYYCRIYNQEGTLLHNYVPARDNDAPAGAKQYGVFDTVTRQFLENNGTVSFVATDAAEVGELLLPNVSNVKARQRFPWNGLVDFEFTVDGCEGTPYNVAFAAKVNGTNVTMTTILNSDGTPAASSESLLPGTYSRIWNAAADLPDGFNTEHAKLTFDIAGFAYSIKFNANGGSGTMSDEPMTYGQAKALTANAFTRTGYTFQGWATSSTGAVAYTNKQSVVNLVTTSGAVVNLYAVWRETNPLYMVIDLSGGSSATSYPVSYLDSAPTKGFTNSTYRTTKLVLRRCNAGSFKMQGSTTTTLTKPFYLSVFVVTQKQWKLVMGSLPDTAPTSLYGSGDGYPAYFLSYSNIRGATNGAKWPSSSTVDSSSFFGKLRTRTKLNFDLPTEAQWEYACRAGTTTTYSYGNSANSAYMWYQGNASSKTHVVGTKKPNNWGLYDMHGNVWEWCLDWLDSSPSYGTNPKGPSSGTYRVLRGGSFIHNANVCTSSYRTGDTASDNSYIPGFRLCITP